MSQSNKFSFILPLNVGKLFLGDLKIEGTYTAPDNYDIELMYGVSLKTLFEFIEHKSDAFISDAITNHIEGLIEDPNVNGFKVAVVGGNDEDQLFDVFASIANIVKPNNAA